MKRRRAFTLIELLVVVAIIAVLMAILLPSLASARELAKRAKCGASLRGIAMANNTYASEWSGWYIPETVAPESNPSSKIYWYNSPEMRSAMGIPESNASSMGVWPANLLCPNALLAIQITNAHSASNLPYSYGYNIYSMTAARGFARYTDSPANSWGNMWYRGIKNTSITRPSECFQFGDGLDFNLTTGGGSYYYIVNGWQEIRQSTQNALTAYRHNRGANFSFFDGHAEWLSYDKVMTNNPPGGLVSTITWPTQLANTRRWECCQE